MKYLKVCGSFKITFSYQITIFEWCVGRCGCKNGQKKRTHVEKRLELCAQNMLNFLVNIIGGGGTY